MFITAPISVIRFLRTEIANPLMVVAATAVALISAVPVSAQTPFTYSTGSCLGCSNCLMFLSGAGMTPIRISASCNNNPSCGAFPSRFADLSTLRGVLQVVNASSDGSSCPQTLINSAIWDASGVTPNDADVVFTGPPGETSVTTRVRYIISNSTTGDANLSIAGRLHSNPNWGMGIPANVSGLEVFSPFRTVSLNVDTSHRATITSSVINGSSCYLLHFPLNEPVFDLPPGFTANCPTLNLVNNIWHGLDFEGDWNASTGGVPCFNTMHLLHSVTGNLTVENTGVMDVDLGGVSQVGGSLSVSGNTSATDVNLGGVSQVGGSLSVSDNTSATVVDLGGVSQVGGNLSVIGNGSEDEEPADGASPLTINLASIATIDGNFSVANNIEDTTVALGPLSLIMGDLTLETKVAPGGTLDLSATAIAGNIDLKTKDADVVLVRTPPPGKTTAAAIKRVESSISAALPADTFSRNEVFSVAHIDAASLPPTKGLDDQGQSFRIDPVAGYQLDVAEDPALQQDATLKLEMDVAGLSAPMQTVFLDAVADGRVMLASKGDGPKDLFQAFEICDGKTPPTAGGCAMMELLDADHVPLPPGSKDAPAFVRFTALTDHFSAYAVVVELRPADVNADGIVNVNDLLAVINAWGPCPAPPQNCAADVAPHPAGDGVVNVNDLLLVINNWGS